MKAAAWIMYALLCFGAATVTTMAVSSQGADLPAGVPESLMGDLDAITTYAGEGRCDAVSGRADRAQSTIDRLPAATSEDLVRELQRSVGRIRTTALRECTDAARAADEEAQRQRELEQEMLEETTPPEPEPEPTQPDLGEDDPAGGPDPGTGEGTTPGDQGGNGGSGGGVTPGDLGEQLQDGVRDMQQRTEETAREWRDRLREAMR